jgi:hypothetical protein
MKRVEVKWVDIRSSDGWHSSSKVDKFITSDNTVCQLGYLYEQDENQIVLMDSYFADKSLYGGIHTIPKGCIIEMKEI